MPRKVAAFMLACALASSGAQGQANAQTKPRIASTSLCGDTYLRALAPDHIGALSWQSRDKISLATETQRRLPQAWDNPERLAALNANLILFGPGEGGLSAKILAKTDKKTHTLTWGEDFDTVITNYTAIGAAARLNTDATLSDLTIRLRNLETRKNARSKKFKILYLSRSGGTAGPGTYVDAAITAAGGNNIITTPSWHNPDPEFLVTLKPDLIITSFFEDGYESINAKPLRHKVVASFIDGHPRLDIPGSLWPCAGPTLIDVAERIADTLETLE